jgi:hypothetical protein
VPLTPSQILSANRRILGGGGLAGLPQTARSGPEATEKLLDEEQSPDADKRSPSILERVKGGLLDVVEPVGSALDYGRAAVASTALETGDLLATLSGLGPQGEFSLNDIRKNINRRMGTGDILEENTLTKGLPLNVKRGLGLVGDVGTDPLNFVTLGTGTAAKTGLRRLGARAGEDVAETVAREGVEAGDSLLAERFAKEQADAASELARREANSVLAAEQRAATLADEGFQLNLLDEAANELPRLSPVARPAILDATAPTVREILGEGVSAKGLERTLSQIGRRGAGGIGADFGRLGGGTLVAGETLGKIPGVQGLGRGVAGAKGSALGTEIRKAWTPYTASKDKFGRAIAEILPTIGLRRKQLVDSAMIDVGKRIGQAIPANITDDELSVIRNALDVGGSVDEARVLLADLPEQQQLLDTLVSVRDETYNKWIGMGKSPDELMSPDEYLRHQLTPESLAQFGVDPNAVRPGTTRSGRMKQRTREGSISAQNEADDLISYLDDPADLVKSSFAIANEVGGNAFAIDALEDFASKLHNFDVSSVVRHSPKAGFREVAPGRWVDETIARDMLDIAKSGTNSKIVRGWDAVNGIIKTQTLFNIVSFPPYVMQNLMTGIAMNAAKLGVGPGEYGKAVGQLRAVTRALKQGGERGFDEAIAKILPPEQAARAVEIRQAGVYDAAHGFEDVSEIINPASKIQKVGRFGTKHTANANAHVEQLLRGAAFNRARDLGMSVDDASRIVRETHLDYTAFGRTRVERDKITRFLFFPTWLMRAPSAIVKTYAQRPGLLNAQARLEMGGKWYDREHNEYGELEGPRLSGPLSFLTALGAEAGDGPIEQLNPLAGAILNPGGVEGPEDIVPPLGNVKRAQGFVDNEEKRSRYLRSLAGVRTGVDYAAETDKDRFRQQLEQRIADRQEKPHLSPTTTKIRLVDAALEAGVEDAYSMTSGQLARALIEAGLSKRQVERIVEDTDAPAVKG